MLLKTLPFLSLLLLSSWHCEATRTIKLGLIDSYPWAFQSSTGNLEGVYPELIKRVSSSPNIEINIEMELLPLARILYYMQHNKIDLTFMSFHSSRTSIMTPMFKVYQSPFALFTKRGSSMTSLDQLGNKTVAQLIGGSHCPCTETPYQRILVANHSQGLRLLLRDKADAISGPVFRIQTVANTLGITDKLNPPIVYQHRDVMLWRSNRFTPSNALTQTIQAELDSAAFHASLNVFFSKQELAYMKLSQ